MFRVFCNICGKELAEDEVFQYKGEIGLRGPTFKSGVMISKQEFHLCHACAREFKDAVSGMFRAHPLKTLR